MLELTTFVAEVSLVHFLTQANLPVRVFEEHQVTGILILEVITDDDLLGWGLSPRQRTRFFKHLKKWQKMRDHVVTQNLWDEMKDEIYSNGITSCEQLKHSLCNNTLQCSNRQQLITSLTQILKQQRIFRQLEWGLNGG
jgi:hypothetical protein